jgi:DNA invertase Pin-like site-specific DNA recombinase
MKVEKGKPNVVIYVRVSSKRQEYASQIKELKNHCAKNRWEVVKIFKEKISGKKSISERDEFRYALNYCENNQIDKFLVWEFTRLGRRSIEIQQNVETIHSHCTSVYIHTMNFETLNEKCETTLEGRLVVALLSQIAELELDFIARRLQRGKNAYIEAGGKIGRKVGYKKPIKETKNYKTICDMLQKGNKLVQIVKASQVSPNTIRKVKAHLKETGELS